MKINSDKLIAPKGCVKETQKYPQDLQKAVGGGECSPRCFRARLSNDDALASFQSKGDPVGRTHYDCRHKEPLSRTTKQLARWPGNVPANGLVAVEAEDLA